MITKPTNWDNYIAQPNHYFETILRVGNTDYDQDDIFSLTASQDLYGDEYSLGGVIMNQWDATLYGVTANAIPKFSKVSVWTRLCYNGNNTSWIPKGIFYTKKPNYDSESETLVISGYDEIFRTEVKFENQTVTTWYNPTLRQVAKHLLEGTNVSGVISTSWTGCGIALEDETQVLNTITMPSAPYGYTVRQVLQDIAIACNGNWTMKFSGTYPNQTATLRLVRTNTSQLFKGSVNLGRNVQSIEIGDTIKPVDQVIINYGTNDDGSTLSKIVGTHTTGRIVELTIQTITDGTQAELIAQGVYNAYQNDTYNSLTATGSELPPIYELGDSVTVNQIASTIGNMTTEYTKAMFTDIKAVGVTEEDDFPYLSNNLTKVERDLRTVSSAITVQANKIGLVVEEVAGQNVIKSASIITAINNDTSSIDISADKVNLTGYTTFADFDGSKGVTVIDGSVIDTQTIKLEDIACKGDTITIKNSSGTTSYGTLGQGYGEDGTGNPTNGIKITSADGNHYLICTEYGVRMQAGNNSIWVTDTGTSIGQAVFG